MRQRFDAVLVDEYQDTNALQAAILQTALSRGEGADGSGGRCAEHLFVPGRDGAQHSRSFPKAYPTATVLKLEQNYRSVQPILEATNAVIALCPNRYNKDLFSTRASRQKPRLVTLVDEEQQSDYVIGRDAWSTWRREFRCGGRRCSSARRITAMRWRWSWAGGTFRS